MRNRNRIIISVIFLLLCMGFIYYNSYQNGYDSNAISNGVLDMVKANDLVNNKVTNKIALKIKEVLGINTTTEILIRKMAHMLEFCLLAILVSIVLFSFGLRGKGAIIYILFLTLFYAVLDEYHQMFIKGRTSSVRDVLIDFSGSIIGVTVFYLIYYLGKKIKNDSKKHKNIVK